MATLLEFWRRLSSFWESPEPPKEVDLEADASAGFKLTFHKAIGELNTDQFLILGEFEIFYAGLEKAQLRIEIRWDGDRRLLSFVRRNAEFLTLYQGSSDVSRLEKLADKLLIQANIDYQNALAFVTDPDKTSQVQGVLLDLVRRLSLRYGVFSMLQPPQLLPTLADFTRTCKGCKCLDGKSHGGVPLVCPLYPAGWHQPGVCPGFQDAEIKGAIALKG